MFLRGLTLSLATLLAFGIAAPSAEADHRKKHRRVMIYDHYYAGPEIVREIPGLRLFFGDYAMSEEEFDALYGTRRDRRFEREFDESYYEPEPAPAKPKKKPANPATASSKKPAAKEVTTASIDKAKKPAAKSTSTEEKAAVSKKPAASTAGMSCDKAGSIVSGYGFSGVKAQTCQGKVYAFNATRDGKAFAIKVDSASGELTEVKKLQ